MTARPSDALLFRDAMARLGAAVSIVTTDGPGGRHGITMSALCSVSDTPPSLLLCVNRASRANALFKANGVVCVNILSAGHRALSARFATAPDEERFRDEDGWSMMPGGCPALADAVAALECRISSVQEQGTHSVIFCMVESIALGGPRDGLAYFDRAYHCLPVRATA